jgi:phytoene synthase
MFSDLHRAIFKAGSRTYFFSSLFFPKAVRSDVSILYAFVRQADNYVDSIPQDQDGFNAFAEKYQSALTRGQSSGDPIIDPFLELARRKRFDNGWVESFLYSMELDTYQRDYRTIAETEEYIYGSAEVIGLMMCRILDLPDEALEAARYQGKAMQYINFIRDLKEDQALGRTYLPQAELSQFGLASLEEAVVRRQPGQFRAFIEYQLARYERWQRKAALGFKYLPKRYLVPVKTAAAMYGWTAGEIKKDPLIVYRQVVKPARSRIIGRIIYEYLFSH